jgi:DNA-directed RNA polymerase specialized sigma24 family protein
MRGRKTPAVAYITRLIKTTSRPELIKILYESPLKPRDISLILDYADGMSYKELAAQNNKSIQRINQWKRQAYEQLAYYLREK